MWFEFNSSIAGINGLVLSFGKYLARPYVGRFLALYCRLGTYRDSRRTFRTARYQAPASGWPVLRDHTIGRAVHVHYISPPTRPPCPEKATLPGGDGGPSASRRLYP